MTNNYPPRDRLLYTPQSPVAPLPMSIDIKVWNPERRKNAHHQQTTAQHRRTLTPHRPDNNSNCNITPHSSHSEDNYYWRPPVRLHKQTPTGVPLVRLHQQTPIGVPLCTPQLSQHSTPDNRTALPGVPHVRQSADQPNAKVSAA